MNSWDVDYSSLTASYFTGSLALFVPQSSAIGQFCPHCSSKKLFPQKDEMEMALINNVLRYMMFKSLAVDLTVHSYRKRAIHNNIIV